MKMTRNPTLGLIEMMRPGAKRDKLQRMKVWIEGWN